MVLSNLWRCLMQVLLELRCVLGFLLLGECLHIGTHLSEFVVYSQFFFGVRVFV